MTTTSLLAFAAAGAFLVGTLSMAMGAGPRRPWLAAGALAVLFLIFSGFTIALEGPTGFWPVHTESYWGNQVWFDLLLAAGTGFGLLVPRARAVGVRPLPWLLLIMATGSIGLLGMVARVLYLESQGR